MSAYGGPLVNQDYWEWLECRYSKSTTQAAQDRIQHLVKELSLCYDDEYRLTAVDDEDGLVAYENAIEHGCCGYHDEYWYFEGKRYRLGFNYGH